MGMFIVPKPSNMENATILVIELWVLAKDPRVTSR